MIDVKTMWATYEDCYLVVDKYRANGATAIQIMSEEEGPIATMTVCLPDYGITKNSEYTFLDTNNFPEAVDVVNEYGLGEMTGLVGYSGYCEYPLVRLDMGAVRKHVKGAV